MTKDRREHSQYRGVLRRLEPLRRTAENVIETVRLGLSRATLSMFEHAPYPLEHTMDYEGDPGLLGPESVSWRVIADPAAFVAGIRGLLIQAAHPEVVAGVEDHSRYRDDPLGRLSRTSAYVTATTFGAMPEVERAVRQVRRAHSVVKGVSERGVTYRAADPGQAAWVHNVLTDSFLATNQAFGELRLSDDEADRFVEEQTTIGALLGADPLPIAADDLAAWISGHPDIAASPGMGRVIDFLSDPPLSPAFKTGYLVLLEAAITTLPSRLLDMLGLKPKPGADVVGKTAVKSLRWALGHSPSWALALTRVGAEVPEEMFRRTPGGVLERAS
jgi:uncharacterized protein (DUF2236 family)